MNGTYWRTLRISSDDYEFAEACWEDRPGRSLLLTVDEHLVADERAEYLTRAVTPEGADGAAEILPARTFVLRWEFNPTLAMAHALEPLTHSGRAGCLFLTSQGSVLPPRGLVNARRACANWLDYLHVAGPGLKIVDATIRGDRTRNVLLSGCAEISRRRIAIAGTDLAARVAAELVHVGAGQVNLLGDDGRGDGRSRSLPADIGAELTRLNPDVVIACETDLLRRAAVASWCDGHLRVLVEVASDDPWLRQHGRADAVLRAVVPGSTRSSASAPGAFAPGLFDDLPLPGASAWPGDLGQRGVALRGALYRRAARAVAAALLELLRGEMPRELRIRVELRGDGSIVGSTQEMQGCAERAGAGTEAAEIAAGVTP